MGLAQARFLVGIAAAIIVAIYGVYLVFAISSAKTTFGCDYLTYDAGARAWLAGSSPYPAAVAEAGTCGIFQYPPPFLALVAPLTMLPPDTANWVWVGMLSLCLPLATLAMPVPGLVRLIVLALAGTSWPVLFAIRIGAIGPVLLLLFALGWRYLDRPGGLAATTAVGGFAKVMPGLLVGWMLLTRRWRAAALTMGAAALVGIGWFALQPSLWLDFLGVERSVANLAVAAPLNVSPASLAYFGGAPLDLAQLLGTGHAAVVLAFAALVCLRRSADASFIVVAIASQVIAPVLWDHYSIVVFLAVAWLLARRQWWALALAIPLNWMLILWFQPWQWVGLMDAAMVAVAVIDWRAARQTARVGAPEPAAAPAPGSP